MRVQMAVSVKKSTSAQTLFPYHAVACLVFAAALAAVAAMFASVAIARTFLHAANAGKDHGIYNGGSTRGSQDDAQPIAVSSAVA